MIRQSDCDDRFRRVHIRGDKGAILPPKQGRREDVRAPSFGVWREATRRG